MSDGIGDIMEIEWLQNTTAEKDKLLLRMTQSFFSSVTWVKNSQEKITGRWNDHDYTCMSVAQLSVVGSDLLTDNLEKAVQFIKTGQDTPGIFSPDTGGGEPTLGSTCLAIWGLYSAGQKLSRNELKQSLSFLEDRTSDMKWDSAYAAYTTLAALVAMENGGERLAKQGEKVRQRAIDGLKTESNWRSGAWIGETSPRSRDMWQRTAVALLALNKANEPPNSLLVQGALAGLEKASTDSEIWNHNRSMAWILKALVYWGHNLESDVIRAGVSRLMNNQNDDGSWGDTRGARGNLIHTTRVLESFSLLFRRHPINQSFFEVIMRSLRAESLKRSIEDQVATNVKAREESLESIHRELAIENRQLKILLTGVSLAIAAGGIIFAVVSLI